MASRSGVKSYRISFDFYITPGVKILLLANGTQIKDHRILRQIPAR